MYFEENATYHIYNRSNETLFYSRDNYIYFLKKIREHILLLADILCYCIMPNHFHLIVMVNSKGAEFSTLKNRTDMQLLSQAFGTTLSSYTQALNKQRGRRGNLFAHKTKAKILNNSSNNYGLNCFMYVHQNPKLAELIDRIEDWEFSSYPDFVEQRNGSLINKSLALEVFQLDINQIIEQTYKLLEDKFDEDFL